MTTNVHTDITLGAPANVSAINAPLGQLDQAITNLAYNVKTTYGAKGNALTVSDGVMNGTTAVLTSVSGKFVAGDVGKSIFVTGAGAAGVPLRTTIASFQSATQVTLAAVSATAVATGIVVWGQNDAAFINNAITAANAAGGGVVYLPPGLYLIDTPAVLLKSSVQLVGAGPGLTVLTGAISGANGLIGTTQSGSTKTVYTNIGVFNLSVNSANGHASSFYNINGLTLTNTEMYFSAGPTLIECLFVEHCQHVSVSGNYCHDFNGNGIQINSTDHFLVADNLILGSANADDLIDIDRDFLDTGLIPSRYGTVTGNVCRHALGVSAPGNGIRVEDSQYVTVVGNTVDDIQTGNGIVVNSAVVGITTKFINVTGNTVSGCVINGIKIAPESTGGAFTNVVVANNILDTCGQAGGSDVRAGIQVGGTTGAAQAGGVLVTGNYLSNCGKGDANGGSIVLYKSGASGTQIVGNLVTLAPSGSLGGIALWNGDSAQTYTNVHIAHNQMISNVAADYNTECSTQAGVTLDFWSATAGDTFVKSILAKSTMTFDGSSVGASANWILMGPIANLTSGNFMQMQTATSAFAGDGILMNFANGSGTFTGKYVDFQTNGASKFAVGATGDVTAAGRALFTGTVPTVASPGSGVSAQSVIAGGNNTEMQVQATLTAVAPGVVIGVVSFNGGPLASAPKAVVCSLSAPTAGVASPPIVGADTFTTSGFTVRSYGPTTVTTGTYIITCHVFF